MIGPFLGSALVALQFFLVIGQNSVELQFPELHDAINKFSLDIYKKQVEKQIGNFVISPIKEWVILRECSSSVENVTRAQILSSLYLKNMEVVEDALERIFKGCMQVVWKTAVFYESVRLGEAYGFHFTPAFESIYTQDRWIFGEHHLQHLSFDKPQNASKIMNEWIKEQKIYPQSENAAFTDAFDNDTVAITISLLNFTGSWLNNFNLAMTTIQDFHLLEGKTKRVFMMNNVGSYRSGLVPDIPAKFIVLPYKNENFDMFSMIVIVPNVEVTLNCVEEKLNFFKLSSLLTANISTIDLYLPKFTLNSMINSKMPIPKRTFPLWPKFGYDKEKDEKEGAHFHSSSFIQKVVLNVNEEGTFTTVNISLSERQQSNKSATEKLRVDHPFLVIICTEDVILFQARVVDPISLGNSIIETEKTSDSAPKTNNASSNLNDCFFIISSFAMLIKLLN